MSRAQYQRLGNNHFVLYIPNTLPPLRVGEGDLFVTQVSWYWSPHRLTSNPFPTLPLNPAPPHAAHHYFINFSDIWMVNCEGVRYCFLGLLAYQPPARRPLTWQVTVYRERFDGEPTQELDIEALQTALERLSTQQQGGTGGGEGQSGRSGAE